jgi:hypothetical protein
MEKKNTKKTMIRTGSWLSEGKHKDRENLNDMHFLKKPCKHRDNKQSKKKHHEIKCWAKINSRARKRNDNGLKSLTCHET